MSSATLASPRALAAPSRPDRIRIAALSAALAVNIAVLVFASRPLPPMVLAFPHAAQALRARWIDPPSPQPATPPPPPPVTPPLHRTGPTPLAHPLATPVAPVRLSDEGTSAPPVVPAHPTLAPVRTTAVLNSGQGERSLAYRSAPLHYPPGAARERLQGTVILRVLVDALGRPLQVEIEQSSGHPLLDRSARRQVLASWRFEPARDGGRAVSAWARVPVQFALREL